MIGIIIGRPHPCRPQQTLPEGPRRWAVVPGVAYPEEPMPVALPAVWPEGLDPAEWATADQIARELGVSRACASYWLNALRVDSQRIGKARYWSRAGMQAVRAARAKGAYDPAIWVSSVTACNMLGVGEGSIKATLAAAGVPRKKAGAQTVWRRAEVEALAAQIALERDPAIWIATAAAADILGMSAKAARDRLADTGARRQRADNGRLYWHIEDVRGAMYEGRIGNSEP